MEVAPSPSAPAQRRSLLTMGLTTGLEKDGRRSACHPSRRQLNTEQAVEEIRRILQSGATVGSPARTFLGVSPPARCSDGIVHDAAWRRRNCRASQQFYPQTYHQLGQQDDLSQIDCRGPSTPRPMMPMSRPASACTNLSLSGITCSASATPSA